MFHQRYRCHWVTHSETVNILMNLKIAEGTHTTESCQSPWANGERKHWQISKCLSLHSSRFSFHSALKIEVQCFLRRQHQANSAAGLATLIRWGQQEWVIDFSSLQHSPSGNSRTPTKAAQLRKVIIQCYLCWTMGLPIPVISNGIVFLNNSPFEEWFF